jgi:predicted unusual protein kinase regulating ubiquinone biosynthesis (AarF/ABC1/UbiB family)
MNLWRRRVLTLWVSFRILVSYLALSFLSHIIPERTSASLREQLHLKNAALFLKTTISLKGLMIKLGQFISARVDLLPKAYTRTLSLLQDEVPPAPFAEIRAKIVTELGADPNILFSSFDEIPIASASFGQVHRAVLKAPLQTEVAIKIQYPDIESIVKTDLISIRLVTRVLQKIFTHIRFDILNREFERIVRLELNYMAEAKNAEKFHNLFLDDNRFVVPEVVWQFTTTKVLTLTLVKGIKINQLDVLKASGVSPQEVAQLLVESYMKQIFIYRFFHADPHPGNLFIQVDPKNGPIKLVFVDFGMMQEIDDKTDTGLRKTILAVIARDTPSIAQGLMDLGFISRKHRGGRLDELEQVVQYFMDRYRDISPRAFQTITIDDIADDLGTTFSIYASLQVPNLFILAGRAVGMLNGLCSELDPSANIIELAKPYAKKYAGQRGGIRELFTQGKQILSALLSLPAALSSFLELSHGSGVQTQMTSEGVETTLAKIYTLACRFLIVLTIVLIFLYIQWSPSSDK